MHAPFTTTAPLPPAQTAAVLAFLGVTPGPADRAALTADYGPDGLFLDQVILAKLIDGRIWRFTTARRPLTLRSFRADGWSEHSLSGDIAAAVARHFGVAEPTLRSTLRIVGAVL